MNMAEDQVDEVVEEGNRAFGEVSERDTEDSSQPRLAKDTVTKETEEVEEDVEESTETETETESEETEDDAEKGKEPELTEKGTKKDPNPQSAVHQELANEKRLRGQMEQILASPELTKKFLEDQYGIKVEIKDSTQQETTVEETPIKEYKPEDLENLDDVANVINGLQKSFSESKKAYEDKITNLEKTVSELVDGGKRNILASKVSQDVQSLLQEKEFDPKSPDYIEGLEEQISKEYLRLDRDPKTGKFRGEHSIAEIGKAFLDIARKARAKGSQSAQTIVKDKSRGKVVTSSEKSGEVDTEGMSPENSIAEGVRKMFGK